MLAPLVDLCVQCNVYYCIALRVNGRPGSAILRLEAARMLRKTKPSGAQTALRLPEEFLKRADRLCAKLAKEPMMRVTRSTVLKMAIARGLDALEQEYK
jgi:hypothetical protein